MNNGRSAKSLTTKKILEKINKMEHKFYNVDFQTGQYSVHGENYPQVKPVSIKIKNAPIRTSYESMPNYVPASKEYELPFQSLFDKAPAIIALLVLAYVFLNASGAFARGPQGEYSSLLENNKQRSSFKNDKELLNYVKQQDKKITKQLQPSNKK